MARFEFRTENSSRFWEMKLGGNMFEVRFGKISSGEIDISEREYTRNFSSSTEALTEYRRLACKKLAVGYKLINVTIRELCQNPPAVKLFSETENPIAIASLCIGEHVPAEVVEDICLWATICIQFGMKLKQFENIWIKLMGGDENLTGALGRTGEKYWLDVTSGDEGELFELYAKAAEKGGDRFIWFDNNAYIDVVALCGDPGARAIEICVLGEKNCQDEKGQWFNDWPETLGPGAPIAQMSCDDATLRDGKVIAAKSSE